MTHQRRVPVPFGEEAPFGTILFDDLPFPIRGGLGYHNLGGFDRKFTIGDPTQADDPILSLLVQSDWSGGGQVRDIRPGSDQGRFWRATLHTRDTNFLTLGRLVETYALAGAGDSRPLGDLAGTYYHADGARQVYEFDPTTLAMSSVGMPVLQQHAVRQGIEFGATGAGSTPVLWIPHGADGFSTFDGTTASYLTTIQPVAFEEWDDQLWALGADGKLHRLTEGSGTWVQECQIDRRHTPRNLLLAYNRVDEPTLHAITDRGVLAYDHVNRRFYPATWRNHHPHGGLGSDVGTGNVLHYAAGMGVRDYLPGGEVSPGGLDRDHGVPAEHRGRIVSLRTAQDEFWCLIEGQESVESPAGPEETQAQSGSGMEEPSFGGSTATVATVYFRTIAGWHQAWDSGGAAGTPTFVAISTADTGWIRVWWGYGQTAYAMALPTDQHNPRAGFEAGVARFQPSGRLETGRNDLGMKGFEKVASHHQVNIPPGGATTTEYVDVSYRLDGGAFTFLGRLDAPGRRILPFGDAPHYLGVSFEDIEFRYDFARGEDDTMTPVVEAFALHLVKNPHPSNSWTALIPLDFQAEAWDWNATAAEARGPDDVKQDLELLLGKRGLVKFQIGPWIYRTRIAQLSGSDATGGDERGERMVSIVEVALDEDEVLA